METKENQNTLNFVVKLSQNDYKQFVISLVYNNFTTKSNTFLLILILASFMYFYVNIISRGENIPAQLIYPLIIFILVFLLLFPLIGLSMADKMMKNNKFLREEQSYCVSDDGIQVTTESMEKKILWNDIFKVIELKKSLVICNSITIEKSFVLPKKCFESEEDIKLLKQFVINNVDKKKIKFKR